MNSVIRSWSWLTASLALASSSRRPHVSDATPSTCLRHPQTIDPVEGCGLVALRERRIVEDCVDEVIDLAAEAEHRLADVHELRGFCTDDVHAEQPAIVAMKDQ